MNLAISTTKDTRTRLLYVNTPRIPPVINGVTTPICKDGSLSLTVTPYSPICSMVVNRLMYLLLLYLLTDPSKIKLGIKEISCPRTELPKLCVLL